MEGNRIGIVGGGQLGRMLTEAAKPMGFEVTVLEKASDEGLPPAVQAGANFIEGSLQSADDITELAKHSDFITWEIEHIHAGRLRQLDELGFDDVQPSPRALEIIQDKFRQKEHLRIHNLPIPEYRLVNQEYQLEQAIKELGPVVVKSRFGGFDGRGNLVLEEADWSKVVARFGVMPDTYAEQRISLQKELAVLIARDRNNNIVTYPTIETEQVDGQCNIAVAPARVEPWIGDAARDLAWQAISDLKGAGVFAVEMFLTTDNELLINEIAPRVHNSGHLTMEGNKTSQFEQHIRAITGMPLGNTETIAPAAMANILFGPISVRGIKQALALPDVHLHLYGKQPRADSPRKIGHLTARADTVEGALELVIKARERLSA